MKLLKEGVVAPDFSLLNQDGESISLSDFRGKSFVVVYFYPKAMTPGCTTQACGLRDSKAKLKKLNLVVLGISPDTPERLTKFVEKEKLNFTLLSDPDNAVAKKYGAFGPKKFMGKEYVGVLRVSFIIDQGGKVVHVMDKVNTKTHHEEVMNFIQEHLS